MICLAIIIGIIVIALVIHKITKFVQWQKQNIAAKPVKASDAPDPKPKIEKRFFVQQRGLLWDVIEENYYYCDFFLESTWKIETEANEHARILNEQLQTK
jgi:hypothetical protein